jgi:hypothetical protein
LTDRRTETTKFSSVTMSRQFYNEFQRRRRVAEGRFKGLLLVGLDPFIFYAGFYGSGNQTRKLLGLLLVSLDRRSRFGHRRIGISNVIDDLLHKSVFGIGGH